MSNREVLPTAGIQLEPGLVSQWFFSAVQRLEDLARRPQNWDSYGASPLQQEAAQLFLDILQQLSLFIQSEPTISLNNEGGLVAEWSSSQSDLELTVNSPDDIQVYYSDQVANREWEIPVSQANMLDKWLWRASAVT
jgi:hypothetical protein